jgi:hypothetical protein
MKSRSSEILETLSCSHPVTLYRPKMGEVPPTLVKGGELDRFTGRPEKLFQDEWEFVKAGMVQGYMLKQNISLKKIDCLQNRYPYFFDLLDLDTVTTTYWGQLEERMLNIVLEIP